jgi:hypothetical protein
MQNVHFARCQDLPAMPEDLLHRVDVRSIAGPVLDVLRDLMSEAVREALEAKGLGQPAGALKSAEAARYIGISRARLYELLKTDPIIKASSIKQGKSRLFLRDGLDQWLQAQLAPEQPASLEAA